MTSRGNLRGQSIINYCHVKMSDDCSTFVAVGTLLPTVPLLLPGRVRTGVRHLLAETHVLRLDGSQVLGLRVLGRPVVDRVDPGDITQYNT